MKCPKCGYELTVRPRTTGKYSASAHLHGHLQQLAKFTGYTLGEVKEVMKEDCEGWPHHEIELGGVVRLVPISETDASSADESAGIEWCHRKASDMGVRLVEISD